MASALPSETALIACLNVHEEIAEAKSEREREREREREGG